MQLRYESSQTLDEYAKGQGWERATLAACPLCVPGTCHFQGLGTYVRKVPAVARVKRYYCPEQRTTFGMLPDFYASRMPGTLDELEQVAAKAEEAPSQEAAAAELRPADEPGAVTLPAAVRWVRRRGAMVRALLLAAMGLFPDRFAGFGASIGSFRERLGSCRVLVALRGICERHLYALPRPLGLNPRALLAFGPLVRTNNRRG
jgi:hypothetical protein